MNLDAAFATYLAESTMAPSRAPRAPQIQILGESIASSETPLPQGMALVRELPTHAPAVRRDLHAHTSSVMNQLRNASVLPVSEQAEAMVDKLLAKNLPKPTTRRVLAQRPK